MYIEPSPTIKPELIGAIVSRDKGMIWPPLRLYEECVNMVGADNACGIKRFKELARQCETIEPIIQTRKNSAGLPYRKTVGYRYILPEHLKVKPINIELIPFKILLGTALIIGLALMQVGSWL